MKRFLASIAIFLGGLGVFLSVWWIGFNALMRGWSHVSSSDDIWVYLGGAALFAVSYYALRFGIKMLRDN